MIINYHRLAKALAVYKKKGYQHIEVPWAVPDWAIRATCPDPLSKPSMASDQILVGSAEQSFIAFDARGHLGKGRFVACTPCFRPGDDDGDLHQPTFMKVELYRNDQTDKAALDQVIEDAFDCLGDLMKKANAGAMMYRSDFVSIVNQTPPPAEIDILINGIEIGSYGIREHGSLRWVYGTGLAEPRFSQALSRPQYVNVSMQY